MDANVVFFLLLLLCTVFQRTPRQWEKNNLKQQISDIISLDIYTPDALFFTAFLTVCTVIIILQHIYIFLLFLHFDSHSTASQFTPFQLSAVCFFFLVTLHAAQRVVIVRHWWNKLSKETRETKWGILKHDIPVVYACLCTHNLFIFDDCV